MRGILFFISLFFFPTILRSQQKALDSLLLLLEKHPQEDSIRIVLLNEVVYAYNTIDPDKGLQVADQAISLAQKLNFPRLLASSFSNKGVNHWAKGEDSLAMVMYKYALAYHEKTGNASGIARMYNNIGLLYFNKSEFYEALDFHHKSLKTFETLKDSNRIATIHTNLAIDYQYISDYPKAINYYLKAIRFYEHNQDLQTYGNGLANAYSSAGIVYKAINDYSTAIQYYDKAIALYEQLNNPIGKASVLGNLGVVYNLLGETHRSISYYLAALSINEKFGNMRRTASDLSNLGEAYLQTGSYDTAFGFLQKAQHIYDSAGDKNNLSIVLSHLGQLLLKAPNAFYSAHQLDPQQRFKLSLASYQKALQLATSIGALDQQSMLTENISKLYEAARQPGKALEALRSHIIIRDSVLNDRKRLDIAKLEARFEFENREVALAAEHEKKLALMAVDAKRQRLIKNSVLIAIVFVVLIAVAGYILYKRKRDVEVLQKQTELKALVAETEMKALRAQINPHFLFNSLNSIADFISKNNLNEADNYLSKFSKLVRLILEHSGKRQIILEDDLHALNIYLELESKRFRHPFTWEIIVAPDVDPAITLIPPLLLQPFAENSIWHGLSRLPNSGHIIVKVYRKSETLHCIVEDNGIGRTQHEKYRDNKLKTQASMGMKITKERIELFNAVNGRNASIALTDLPQGLRAELQLPFETVL